MSVCVSDTFVSPAKIAELIEMPFGSWLGRNLPKQLSIWELTWKELAKTTFY